MDALPTLYTPRLKLRTLTLADAPRIQELASSKLIAATTASIPHPYPAGAAEKWIAEQAQFIAAGTLIPYGITLAGTRTPGRESDPTDTGHLIGTIALHTPRDQSHARAELGYWIGVNYWGRGFATEAARILLDYAFNRRGFHRIVAEHFADNPASGRVMQKLGLKREGILRQHFNKWGEYKDVVCYAILAEEWFTQKKRLRLAHLRPRASTEVAPC